MIRKLVLVSIIFLVSGCGQEEPETKSLSIVGEWTVATVTLDGVHKPEWEGAKLKISQSDMLTGSYRMPNPVDDSIWGWQGRWLLQREDLLILDDSVYSSFFVESSHLQIIKLMPWTVPPCVDLPCPLIVTGVWAFDFEKR